ncbi:MAG: hypothetical protein P8X49_15495 [Syntrophobacterales bacterium]|jgi:hypothetical protein
MKRIVFGLLVLLLLSPPVGASGAPTTKVEILYMNHGPLQSTLEQIKGVMAQYGDKVSVSWYDFESPQGEQFKAQKGITQHIPLMIWINGQTLVQVGQKEVEFVGFPTGAGPAFFQGKWSMGDLKAALAQATGNK